MSQTIHSQPLSADSFSRFGDVLDASGEPDKFINQGRCGRFHNRAKLDFGINGQPGISIFRSEAFSFPISLKLVERHPDGSQAFIPMSENPFLVVVANDIDGTPDRPQAFVTNPGQGINLNRGVWHGVLTPLSEPGLFAVIDRIGKTPNLEEYFYNPQYIVE